VREIFYKKPMAINRRSFVVRALAAGSLPFTPVRCAAAVPPPVAAAGWVGTYLLEGALEYEGGQIMAGALGEPVLSDVRSWIANAVAELDSFIEAALKATLTQLVVANMQAELDAVNTAIYEYANLESKNQEENRYLLQTCDSATAILVPLSLSYDQIYITTAAMGFKLFTVLALYNLDRDKSHITSAIPMMDSFVSKSVSVRDSISARMDPSLHLRVSNCNFALESTGAAPTPLDLWAPAEEVAATKKCQLFDDGQSVAMPRGFQVQAEYNRRKDVYLKLKADFLSLTGNSINKAIECYQGMCKRVGETYTPPATPSNVTPLPAFPGVITMPGALVKISRLR
jgi:hypothetical protein